MNFGINKGMNNLSKISIITPTLNSEKDIEACILSVTNQSYENKEHLIIDGLSTDKTIEIVNKYAEKYPHIRLVLEKDNGIYDAMNKGIDRSNGEWIYFLGSDDIFYNEHVLDKVFKKNNTKSLDVIYGNVLWDNSGNIYDGEFTLTKLIEQNICHQAIFFKKNIFQKLGNFNIRYRVLADWAFNLRWFSDDKIKRKYIPLTISHYRLGGFSSKHCDEIFFEDVPKIIDKNFPPKHADAYKKILNLKYKSNYKEDAIFNQSIYQKNKEIEFMKSSKFWKLRERYMSLKNKFKI